MTDTPPESLLPYERWTERALRAVVADALQHVAEHGLPGEHHFYLSFRTDHPGVVMPAHLRARYPQEITIVLQHRFWDLAVDRAAQNFTVSLSFGGVPARLVVPFAALTGFHDPAVRFGLRFEPEGAAEEVPAAVGEAPESAPAPPGAEEPPAAPAAEAPQVVSLEAFRRKRE